MHTYFVVFNYSKGDALITGNAVMDFDFQLNSLHAMRSVEREIKEMRGLEVFPVLTNFILLK